MEYGLGADLPIYAGGLGVLAGDAVKAASDLRLPVIAIGLFWSEGYTVQRAGGDGQVHDEYPPVPRHALVPTGARAVVSIRGHDVEITAHRVERAGVTGLYLLEPVDEAHRGLTRRLYGGVGEDRIAQEMILGIGGVRI